MDNEEAKELAECLLIKNVEEITFLDFAAGLLGPEFFGDEDRLKVVFRFMDTDESGYIDPSDILKLFKRFGRSLKPEKIQRMIMECDFDSDGRVSFDEFVRTMNSENAISRGE